MHSLETVRRLGAGWNKGGVEEHKRRLDRETEVSWDQSHRPERLENFDFMRSVERKPLKWLPSEWSPMENQLIFLTVLVVAWPMHGRGRVGAWKLVRKLFSGPDEVRLWLDWGSCLREGEEWIQDTF